MGYLPVAVAFGVTSAQMGLSSLEIILASALIFAGAGQFLLVALWSKATGLLSISLVMFFTNLRHVFYGPSIFSNLKIGKKYIPLISFGLTDEVYATCLAEPEQLEEEERSAWMLGLELGAYSAWVGGTAIGSIVGDQLLESYPVIAAALSFALPALFLSLFLGLLKSFSLAMAAAVSIPVITLQYRGYPSAAIITGIFSGILASIVFKKER